MAVKYHCKKCGKRFIDWGAEKLGYSCPDCEGEKLVRVGLSEEKAVRRPSLKRKPRKSVPARHAAEEEILVPDIEEIEAEEVEVEPEEEPAGIFLGADDEGAQVGLALEEVLPAGDLAAAGDADLAVAEDLAFDNGAAPVGEEAIDETVVDDEWSE